MIVSVRGPLIAAVKAIRPTLAGRDVTFIWSTKKKWG